MTIGFGLSGWEDRPDADICPTSCGNRFEDLIEALDVLDGSEAFVAPTRMREVARAEGSCRVAVRAR